MDVLLHIANILYLFSYSVKDIMLLRVLTVVAATCLLPYFFFQPEPMIAAIAWNVLFTVMNVYRIVLLYLERRPVYFDEREQELYKAAFPSLSPHQFAKLLKIAAWKESKVKDLIFDRGAVLDQFIALREGCVDIRSNGRVVEQRNPGDFIGETCLLTEAPIKASVVVNEDAHYAAWPRGELKALLDEDPNLHASLQRIISQTLIRKLEAA